MRNSIIGLCWIVISIVTFVLYNVSGDMETFIACWGSLIISQIYFAKGMK